MKVIRIVVAILLVASTVPIAVFGLAWAVAAASGCPLQFETRHICTAASLDIGWLLDGLVHFGVLGALTFGLGVYVFAGWVAVELAAIVLGALRG
jgi:hypothetical protein